MHFTIEKATWRCGGFGATKKGHGYTELLNIQGFMCCLGQVAKQMGVSSDSINGMQTPQFCKKPDGLVPILVNMSGSGDFCNSQLSQDAMQINDDTTIDASERERKLVSCFVEHGHTLEFVGDYPLDE